MNEVYNALIPPQWRVFLSDKGLTQAEANHRANLIKEKAESIKALFESTAAYKAVMTFEDGEKIPLDVNVPVADLRSQALLEGENYALSAWLREAIKAKAELIEYITKAPFTAFDIEGKITTFAEQMPSMASVPRVVLVTDKDIMAEMSIKDRAEYLTLEAHASHLGKKIHKGGVISGLYRDIQQAKSVSFKELPNGNGYKAYVVNHTPLYDAVELSKDFFFLQSEHRAFENKLNFMKANIQNEVTTRNAQLQREYSDAYNLAHTQYQNEMREYNEKHRAYSEEYRKVVAELESFRLDFIRYASALKIVIPDALAHINEAVKAQ